MSDLFEVAPHNLVAVGPGRVCRGDNSDCDEGTRIFVQRKVLTVGRTEPHWRRNTIRNGAADAVTAAVKEAAAVAESSVDTFRVDIIVTIAVRLDDGGPEASIQELAADVSAAAELLIDRGEVARVSTEVTVAGDRYSLPLSRATAADEVCHG